MRIRLQIGVKIRNLLSKSGKSNQQSYLPFSI